MNIAQRAPSTNWEPATLPDRPHCSVWVWYKPGGVPQDVMFLIPDETFPAAGGPITVRQLIATIGLDAATIYNWSFAGMTYDSQQGNNPLLDQPIPPSGSVGNPTDTGASGGGTDRLCPSTSDDGPHGPAAPSHARCHRDARSGRQCRGTGPGDADCVRRCSVARVPRSL